MSKYGQVLVSKSKQTEYKKFISKHSIKGKLYEIGDTVVDDWMRKVLSGKEA